MNLFLKEHEIRNVLTPSNLHKVAIKRQYIATWTDEKLI